MEWRRSLLISIRNHLVHAPLSSIPKELELVHGVSLHLRSLVEEVWELVFSFSRWRNRRVATDPAVLGGEPVFAARVSPCGGWGGGGTAGGGEGDARDYPYLKAADIEFAKRFARAYPRVGRPRETAKASPR